MLIQPKIRQNIFLNAHPLGCQANVLSHISEVKDLGLFKGPKNVLIIGGSSGYGLSSRIALAFGASANTINVSFESAPKGKRTGTAGYWNNAFFQHEANKLGTTHFDFLGDAFSKEMKDDVIKKIRETVGKVDLVIYSLAAGARKNSNDELVRSSIKSVGEPAVGKTIDIADLEVQELTVDPASKQEIDDTIFVMGGSDWYDWITQLNSANVLDNNCKTISYTYIGGPTTQAIYRHGTLGFAKEDLEKKAALLNKQLKESINGEALVSSSKAVVSKASVFIPQMPIYVSCLFDVMTKAEVHETITEHKHRLFKDMVYGEKRILDDHNRIRLDHLEMETDIQRKTNELMLKTDDQKLLQLDGTKQFIKEFYQINGFRWDNIDYEKELDLSQLESDFPYNSN
jgi:enoyl-[acyl-carrier protein] reductase/trans-2-enoyl-CoA reductase (NAD+)